MKKIEPFRNFNDALLNLDNGGRFYNILTKADDGVISKAELGKVGGIFYDKQQMILFFELSISKLGEEKRNAVISKLEDNLKALYTKYKPIELLPSEAYSKGIIASNTIITGIPTLTESKSEFVGFIMIPMVVGKVTTFTMIPLIDMYDVYEIRDEASDENFLIAHAKGATKLPKKKIKVAGVLKELRSDRKESVASKRFLEAIYHIEIH
ncbi:hypothetical protein H2O64_03915 [Kordia sp. YSTF-M3]|uniref:Uncharacterized protein n=1 Tax=Kordia aestuariivivens TaxID=2759037 RepID=A0ABR7Q604_9FLAO|nr:hypothetical protein [Kordia aestuariivivens]MBC8753801.1 hypothetical protein [Kordia aestuariivivens]